MLLDYNNYYCCQLLALITIYYGLIELKNRLYIVTTHNSSSSPFFGLTARSSGSQFDEFAIAVFCHGEIRKEDFFFKLYTTVSQLHCLNIQQQIKKTECV